MRQLVVGVDGAAASRQALEWAARAVGTDGHVHAITAIDPEPHIALDPRPPDEVEYRSALQRELDRRWCEPVRRHAGRVTAGVVDDEAPEALADAAERLGADAIVVGAHVSATGVPRVVGRTIRQLLSELPCPLVVVPASIDVEAAAEGPIVAGVGHGAATEAAVRWAAQEAEQQGTALGLVRAKREAPVFQLDGLLEMVAWYIDPSVRDEWIGEDLAALAVAAQAATADEIPIATTAAAGSPSTTLVAESAAASLLVIGLHPSKVFGDRHVTRTLRHALTHARCPVVVVPAPAD